MSVNIDIKRIEVVVTHACSGKCKHCAVDITGTHGVYVDADAAVNAVTRIANRYSPESIMTFGGEPLLYVETVCRIREAARDCGIPMRQLITNGFFSRDEARIKDVAAKLCAAGVNGIMLSVDAFHQEYIPIEPIMHFAQALMENHVPYLRVHPAWLVNRDHPNPYNQETARLLGLFTDMGIAASDGNNISPSGAALKHLHEYFDPPESVDLTITCGQRNYTSRLDEISCVSINPNGDLMLCAGAIGNVYRDDVLTILDEYDPYADPAMRALITGGAAGLLRYAHECGLEIDTSDCYFACDMCRKIMAALEGRDS